MAPADAFVHPLHRLRAQVPAGEYAADPGLRALSTGLLELHMAAGDITKTGRVNDDIYDHLGERWYTARDDPIALLRAEARARNPWIAGAISQAFPSDEVKVLDIGCGGGFLSNYLAEAGFTVIGLDAAARVLQPGGLFFFATFNRNFISWLFGIKGVEWFVKNTPPRLHELSHFIKPAELRAMCEESGLRINELRGFAPR